MDRAFPIVDSPLGLARTLAHAQGASEIAVDIEGNGLFVYKARLCTMQLAWRAGDEVHGAIIDTLACDPAPLAPLLGRSGPPKLLHDLTFDARMLQDSGIVLDHVRDTSVIARMLGRKETGLASLLAAELGLSISKGLQQHDWSRRPLSPEQIEYLSADVRHLGELYAKLSAEVARMGIEDEVAEECAFKLECARAAPREKRPAYLRIKGAEALDHPQRALLRALVEAREGVAAREDLPPFKVIGNEQLLEVARQRPSSADDLGRCSARVAPRQRGVLRELVLCALRAVAEGLADPEPSKTEHPDRALLALRRSRHRRLTAWRHAEAEARGVDAQVILPGHCLTALAEIDEPAPDAIQKVPGLGQNRAVRYLSVIESLLRGGPDP